MKLVNKSEVIAELEFQKNQMIKRLNYIKSCDELANATKEEIMEIMIDEALSYFDIAKHGIEEHLEEYVQIKNNTKNDSNNK